MRQGWIQPARGALACASLLAVTLSTVAGTPSRAIAGPSRVMHRSESPARTEASAGAKKSAAGLRQFTGYVTSMDATTVTVEKRGKKPETRVFTKHDELRTTGDVAKETRVTVFYRDEGGRSIAHRIVAKAGKAASARSRG